MVEVGAGAERSASGLVSSLGILIAKPPTTWIDAHAVAADLAELERSGCDGIWFVDHLFWGAPLLEPLAMCAVAAAATTTCRIGPAVLQLPLRRTAAVGKAAATLQQLSAGRFVLGVGVGEHAAEYERVGAPFTSRGRDLDRALVELRALWQPEEQRFGQRPVPEPIPMWIGGRGDAAVRRAAHLGDGWLPLFLSPEAYGGRLRELRALQVEIGRHSTVEAAVVVPVAVTGERWSSTDARAWFSDLYGIDPSSFDRYLVAGSPERCAAALQDYADAGASHVVGLMATEDPVADFARLRAAVRW